MLTWKQNLKHLTKKEYDLLYHMCRLSKNVYNEALYNIRQYYFLQGEYLNYNANYPLMKVSSNYKQLGANVAQQTMRCVDAAFQSYFRLLDAVKKNKFSPREINIPRYLDKDGLYPLHFPQASTKDGYFLVSMSPELKKSNTTRIRIKIPPQIVDKRIHQIHIVPKCKGKFFEVRYMFEEDRFVKGSSLDFSKILAIDPGINNFATCATSDYDAFIVDGKYLKSMNQWYNKELARLSTIKDHQGLEKQWTNRQYLITRKRDRRIQDYIYCSSKYIVNYCIDHKIGNIVFGYNEGFQEIKQKHKNVKQNFKFLPYGRLKSRLKFLCEQHGIKFHIQEESYTSLSSFFDNDEIPVWNPQNPKQGTFSGSRVSRGLYRTSNKTYLNADVNGALNIMRKSKLNDIKPDIKQCRGHVISPLRIRCTPKRIQLLKKNSI